MNSRNYLSEENSDPVFIRKHAMSLSFLMEFFEILNKIKARMNEKYWLQESRMFSRLPLEKQREVIVALSELASIPCFKTLQSLEPFITGSLSTWFEFAVENSRMYLQGDLPRKAPKVSDSGQYRRIFLVASGRKVLSELQTGFVRGIFDDAAAAMESSIEDMEERDSVFIVTILLHVDVRIDDLWNDVHAQTTLLSSEYLLNNTHAPSSAEIAAWKKEN